jgi:heme/copper-type cytochrome/quinol oxidase subunit 2
MVLFFWAMIGLIAPLRSTAVNNNALIRFSFCSRNPFVILPPAARALKLRPSGKQMNPSPYRAPFSSAHVRATIVKILLIAGAVVTGVLLLAEAISLAFPPLREGGEIGDNALQAVVLLMVFLAGVFDLIIYITTVVFFCVWLYRASDNLRAFNQWSRPDYSPGWAVGSFFIPFVNLVVPYRAVKEVWQKSNAPDEALLAEPDPPAFFAIWWTFWLLASFAGRISMRLSFDDKVEQSTATKVSIVASALSIVAALLAYLVVEAIDQKQEETSKKLKLKEFPEPPPPPTNLPPSDVVVSAPGNFQQS